MSNNMVVAITADVASARASLERFNGDVRVTRKELRDLQAVEREYGATPELSRDILAKSEALARLEQSAASARREIRKILPAGGEAAAGLKAVEHGSSGVTRELIVMGRELSRGNFSRMAGSATILAQRLGVLTPEVLGVGGAIVAITAPFAILAVAMEQGAEQLATFNNRMEATSGYAGVTVSELQEMAKGVADFANVGVGAANRALMQLASSGRFTGETIRLVGADAERMAELTGISADKWVDEFLKMDESVTTFADAYIQHYGQLTTAQAEYIRKLEEQGRKEEAEYALAKDVYDYLGNKAPENLGYLERAWRGVAGAMGDFWDGLKAIGRNDYADQLKALEAQRTLYSPATEGGRTAIAKVDVEIGALRTAEAAEERRAQATAKATAEQKAGAAAAEELHRQFEASRSSGERLRAALAQINKELAQAVAADPAHKALYEQEAAAARAQAVLSDSPRKARGVRGAESPIAGMEAELRQSELNMRRQTGDWLQDMSALEARFWADQLDKARKGTALYADILKRKQSAEEQAGRRTLEQRRSIASGQISANLDVQRADISDRREGAEADYTAGIISAQQRHDILMALAQEEAQAQIQAEEDRARLYADDVAKVASAADREMEIRAQLRSRILEIERQLTEELAAEQKKRIRAAETAAHKQAESWSAANREVFSAEGRLISGVIGGRQSMAQILDGIAVDEAEKEIEADLRALTQRLLFQAEGVAATQASEKGGILFHLAAEAQKTAATATGIETRVAATAAGAAQTAAINGAQNARDVTGAAAVAAANAYKAMAGIPVVGPMLGAAAAAATFSAVEAFGSMASLAVGTNNVPDDMVAQIHKGERIIPAADNKALMAAVAGGGGRGDIVQHNHFAPTIHAMARPDLKQLLQDQGSDMIGFIRQAFRDGALSNG